MRESWTQLKARLILERGSICERCRTKDATDLHHALIGRMKSKPELNVEENAELLCKDCHANVGGYDDRCEFWLRQCVKYGIQHMRSWYDGLDLKIKERYKCLGNAVTTTVIKAIGKELLNHIESQPEK